MSNKRLVISFSIVIVVLVAIIIALIVVINTNNGNNLTVVEGQIIEHKEAQNIEPEIEEEYVEVLPDGTKFNVSSKLSDEKEYMGIKFTNIQLTNKNDQSSLIADVTNTNNVATSLIFVDIIMLDDELNEMGTVKGVIPPLEVGATSQFFTSMQIDYSNAYNFRIVATVE